MRWSHYDSPLGRLTLVAGERGLRELHFPGRGPTVDPSGRDPELLREVCAQLEEYFAGERETFDVALDLAGTAFRRRVWQALREVPYGEITTYGRLARDLGVRDSVARGGRVATAAQKVGWAIGATPVPIVVPCHRVVAGDGSLTGYRGGLRRKRALLDFEAAGATWSHKGQLALL